MKPTNTLLKFYRWYVNRRVLVWLFFAIFMAGAVGPHAVDEIRLGEPSEKVMATTAFLFVFGIAFFYNFFKYALWRQLRLGGYTALRLKGSDE
jgi:hypothetical protein